MLAGLGNISTSLTELILVFTITPGKMCYYFSIMQRRGRGGGERLRTRMLKHRLALCGNSIITHLFPSLHQVCRTHLQVRCLLCKLSLIFQFLRVRADNDFGHQQVDCPPFVTLHQTYQGNQKLRGRSPRTLFTLLQSPFI